MAGETAPDSQGVAGRLFNGINSTLATIAQALGFTSQSTTLFILSFIALCVLPLVIAAINLPELEIYRPTLEKYLGPAATPYVFNSLTPMVAVWTGFLVTVCINRGWSLNEYQRSQIVAGQSKLEADALPDLLKRAMWAAFFSAIFIPFILLFSNNFACSVSQADCLFHPSPKTLSPWMIAGLDLELRTVDFFGIPDVYSMPTLTEISSVSPYALHIKMALRVIAKVVILATLFDFWRINKTITEAVDKIETPKGFDLAVKLGKRVLPRLLKVLRRASKVDRNSSDQTDIDPNKFAQTAAKVIGEIGAPSALPSILAIAENPRNNAWTRARAVRTIFPLFEHWIEKLPQRWFFGPLRIQRTKKRLEVWAEKQLEIETKGVLVRSKLESLINQLKAQSVASTSKTVEP